MKKLPYAPPCCEEVQLGPRAGLLLSASNESFLIDDNSLFDGDPLLESLLGDNPLFNLL